MANVLITGAAGYLGSVLTPTLLFQGHEVAAVDNFSHSENSLSACCSQPNFNPIRGDARDERLMLPLLKNADIVIPLAAIVGAKACDNDKTGAETTNFGAVRMLVDNLSVDQALIIPNTNSGYGIGGEAECTEDSPLNPISLYGRTKCQAEDYAMRRENSVAFRLATVFGASPRMRIDLLLNDMVLRALTDRTVVLFEAHFRRNFVHVRDIGRAFLHAIDNFTQMRGQVFNCGDSDANMTKMQLCERIKAHIPDFTIIESEIGVDPDKRDYNVSNARLENTGFSCAVSVDAGIMELIRLYQTLNVRRYANA